jgi:uncharacterized protein (DUF1501 family)
MHHPTVEGGCPEFLSLEAMHRREFLRVGGLSALGLSLPAFFAARARASTYGSEQPQARARSCILLFLAGGPSHFETFDPKPDAPSDVRTIYETIRSNVPGTHLCEYLPDLARQAHRFALVRSAWHRYGGHFGGHRYALSGHAAPGNADQPSRPDDKPGLIALAGKYLRGRNQFPSAIMTPWIATDQGSGASGGMGGGTLGRQYDPVRVEVDPRSVERPGSVPVFRVPEFALQPGTTPERLASRRGLLNLIENQRGQLLSSASEEMDPLYQSAFELLTSERIKEGFDLDRENDRLRDRYGQNAFGQSCLLARRLVERGARFIQVNFARTVTQRSYGWDTHDKGAETLKDHLLPKLNAGVGTLLSDLADRGLLDETLVVAMGEFGRTPRIKPDGGRDHWPQCYSLLLAGGGIHGGLVYGRSDRTGAKPASDPVEAREILATILTLLGVPTFVTDTQGRAAPLFEGVEPIRRLYA